MHVFNNHPVPDCSFTFKLKCAVVTMTKCAFPTATGVCQWLVLTTLSNFSSTSRWLSVLPNGVQAAYEWKRLAVHLYFIFLVQHLVLTVVYLCLCFLNEPVVSNVRLLVCGEEPYLPVESWTGYCPLLWHAPSVSKYSVYYNYSSLIGLNKHFNHCKNWYSFTDDAFRYRNEHRTRSG